MNYEVRQEPASRLVGREWDVSTRDGENFRTIPGYWEETMKDGSLQKLMELAKPDGLFAGACLGVAFDIDDANDRLKYMIGVESDQRDLPPGWSAREVPAMTYAIFKDQGSPLPKAIERTLTRIFQEWFPSTKYEHDDGPEIEVYHDESRYEIWIPVVTK